MLECEAVLHGELSRTLKFIVVALLVCMLSGCASILMINDVGGVEEDCHADDVNFYGGTRVYLSIIGDIFTGDFPLSKSIYSIPILLIDLPLCLAMDTLLIPVSIQKEIESRKRCL